MKVESKIVNYFNSKDLFFSNLDEYPRQKLHYGFALGYNVILIQHQYIHQPVLTS